MSKKELVSINEETLDIVPQYELLHNAISRSAHNLSATAQKLAAMAMALLPADMSNLAVSFTFAQFCRALGFGDGKEQYKIFKDAVNECMQNTIRLEYGPVTKRGRSWRLFTWFEKAEFNSETNICSMTFGQGLADVLLDMRRLYSKMNLVDIGKLQSKYGIRHFELAKSYESLAGQDGNRKGEWYYERSIPDLRFIMGIPDEAYSRMDKFKRDVIENPLKELNGAGIGIEITAESIKKGRNVVAQRFNCKQVPRTTQTAKRARRKKSASVADTQRELPISDEPESRIDKELYRLRELYPDEFALFYAEELEKSPRGLPDGEIKRRAAEYRALQKLREKHGIVK
jgi:plasmid replication initiation protein